MLFDELPGKAINDFWIRNSGLELGIGRAVNKRQALGYLLVRAITAVNKNFAQQLAVAGSLLAQALVELLQSQIPTVDEYISQSRHRWRVISHGQIQEPRSQIRSSPHVWFLVQVRGNFS